MDGELVMVVVERGWMEWGRGRVEVRVLMCGLAG